MITAQHLHAMVIHFPIAILMVGFLSEIIALFSNTTCFKQISLYLLIAGTFSTVTAYITGSYAEDGLLENFFQEPIGMHEESSITTMVLALLTVILKLALHLFKIEKKWSIWVVLTLYTFLIVSLTRTAFLGKELVYKYGAGIEIVQPIIKD